jgi:hypothetical protein
MAFPSYAVFSGLRLPATFLSGLLPLIGKKLAIIL